LLPGYNLFFSIIFAPLLNWSFMMTAFPVSEKHCYIWFSLPYTSASKTYCNVLTKRQTCSLCKAHTSSPSLENKFRTQALFPIHTSPPVFWRKSFPIVVIAVLL